MPIVWVVQVMEQERASREAAGEADLRRSIEASLADRVKEEKLKLSRKALELGKQKVTWLFFSAFRQTSVSTFAHL
jgi:hypothetical protein